MYVSYVMHLRTCTQKRDFILRLSISHKHMHIYNECDMCRAGSSCRVTFDFTHTTHMHTYTHNTHAHTHNTHRCTYMTHMQGGFLLQGHLRFHTHNTHAHTHTHARTHNTHRCAYITHMQGGFLLQGHLRFHRPIRVQAGIA